MNQLLQIPRSEEYYQLPFPGYPYLPAGEEKEVHLRDYWKVIVKRRWIIIALFLIVLVATAVGTFTMKPVYRGTVSLQINKENPQIMDFKEIFSVNMWDQDYYQTQYKILESRSLAKRVLQALKLSEHPDFQPGPDTPFQKWKSDILRPVLGLLTFSKKKPTSEKDSSESKKETALINQFLGKLKVEPIRNSRLVKVHFDSSYPELCAQVPNTLATSYIQQSVESRFTATEQVKEWLSKQLEDLKAKVERADEALQAFGSKHDIISLEDRENVTLQRLNELNDTLTKAEADRMAREALHKQTKDRNFEFPSILENKLIMDLKQSYIQLETQYVRLSETFKPEYPEMVRLRSQMQSVQKRMDLEVGKIIAGMKNEYELSLRKETLLRHAFDQQKAKVIEMKDQSIQYNILKREADTNKELYKGLLQRMKEAGVSAGLTVSNIQVVDQAEIPTGPYKPNKRLNLLLAAVVGLFLGVGLAFFFEYLDNTVKTPEDVEQMIRLPSFGMVPEISNGRRSRLEKGASYPVELITHRHPKSILSEAYRNVRTSLLLSFSEKPPKKIAITSPNPVEGKTTTVINTAIALSQTGAHVVVVDTDMRKPRIHHIFNGGDNGTGLSNFLSGNADLASIVKKTEVPNLYYIPSGPIPPNPSELLGSNRFKNMMGALEKKFDHVLLDTPPVLGFADSLILSSSVDGVVLVVVGGKTPRETLQRAKEVLHQVNAKILGVVINRVDIQRGNYGYYYYKYHYYYGKEGKKKELPFTSEEKSVST